MFGNLVLADEINRAPAKVQSALLEVMQEQQVTIGGNTYAVPTPFLVMATQNPIESEGTYPLPEAQVDRFLFKLMVGYPTPGEEASVVGRSLRGPVAVDAAASTSGPRGAPSHGRRGVRRPRRRRLRRRAGRRHAPAGPSTACRSSCRSSSTAPARAGRSAWCTRHARWRVLRGRRHVVAADVRDLAADVLRHRLVLSYDALAEGVNADDILSRVIEAIPLPAGERRRTETPSADDRYAA